MKTLLAGLLTGAAFGFLLQKARVARYDKQIGALRLLDMTIVKFMLSSVLVGMIGVYLCKDLGLANLMVKPAVIGANIAGGLIFGIGWGLLGYCPGTSMAALGEGRYDSVWGILGMLAGAGLYAESFPALSGTILDMGKLDPVTIPELLDINHWFIIIAVSCAFLVLLRYLEKKGL